MARAGADRSPALRGGRAPGYGRRYIEFQRLMVYGDGVEYAAHMEILRGSPVFFENVVASSEQ